MHLAHKWRRRQARWPLSLEALTAAATGLALLLAAGPGEGERLLPALSVDPAPAGEPGVASVRLSEPGARESAADRHDPGQLRPVAFAAAPGSHPARAKVRTRSLAAGDRRPYPDLRLGA